jgi:hypothetical protein
VFLKNYWAYRLCAELAKLTSRAIMEKYPTIESNSQALTKGDPDFAKFTQDDWNRYNHEKLYKENEKLKGILSWIAFAVIIGLCVLFGR